ncbi:hypothetical protein HYH02_013300 [Chlamydomonas schloesseri]|uniref:Uncharacterized protein n=1 Tax=Chlamydomonas schloesseri TaxID=2026947 RepID=A0A835VW59_9CHLO|nr:hypothetical protein HYH02_013300 [Chlamydomonas schloesseri]|eukprot:KAG2431607.1 hypothetical protein HYH02_013300 [Chlamydomonas schloesseri]
MHAVTDTPVEELRAAWLADNSSFGIVAALLATVAFGGLMVGFDVELRWYNEWVDLVYACFLAISLLCNVACIFLSARAYSVASLVPAKYFMPYLALRGNFGFSREPGRWIGPAFVSLFFALVCATFMLRGPIAAAVVLGIALFALVHMLFAEAHAQALLRRLGMQASARAARHGGGEGGGGRGGDGCGGAASIVGCGEAGASGGEQGQQQAAVTSPSARGARSGAPMPQTGLALGFRREGV